MLAIVDDGSTDDSFQVATGLFTEITGEKLGESELTYTLGKIKHLPAILIHNPTAKKQGFARNQGIIALWEGSTYFCPLDADDKHMPEKINTSVWVAESEPQRIGLVYSDVIIHDERDGTCYHELRSPYDRGLLERTNIISNSPLISRLALRTVGLYDESLPPCEDWDLWLRITEHFTAVHIAEPLQTYTITPQSCTFTSTEEHWQTQRHRVLMKLQERQRANYGNSNEAYSPSESSNRQ